MGDPIPIQVASADLDADNLADADKWFQKIVSATTERILWPVPCVRSVYFLGQIHQKWGDLDVPAGSTAVSASTGKTAV